MLDLTEESLARAVRNALRPALFPKLAAFIGGALAFYYRLIGKDRYDDFRLERVEGVPILVTPSVFNPKVPRTGAFLAAHLDARQVRADAEVLDMGTGSGVCAIFAARHARRVVAVDINPAAVHCADINARLNHVEHRIELRHGDLFAPVAGERFDLVVFNSVDEGRSTDRGVALAARAAHRARHCGRCVGAGLWPRRRMFSRRRLAHRQILEPGRPRRQCLW